MQAETGSLRAAGSNRALGRAQPEGDGYLVSGRWDFQSGIEHASWMFGTSVLMDGDEVRRNDQGEALTRAMAVPVEAGTVIDTWHVVGLRGTGSFDFALDGVHVPAGRSVSRLDPPTIESALYRQRFFGVWSHTVHAGCTLGIARGALDELRALASARGSTTSSALLRDRPFVQNKIGEAEAIVRSARAYLFEAIDAAWEAASEQRTDPRSRSPPCGSRSRTPATSRCAPSTSCSRRRERTRPTPATASSATSRDVHAAVQHGATAPRNYETAGRVFLGLPAGLGGW